MTRNTATRWNIRDSKGEKGEDKIIDNCPHKKDMNNKIKDQLEVKMTKICLYYEKRKLKNELLLFEHISIQLSSLLMKSFYLSPKYSLQ